jgi:hypothetical protein
MLQLSCNLLDLQVRISANIFLLFVSFLFLYPFHQSSMKHPIRSSSSKPNQALFSLVQLLGSGGFRSRKWGCPGGGEPAECSGTYGDGSGEDDQQQTELEVSIEAPVPR